MQNTVVYPKRTPIVRSQATFQAAPQDQALPQMQRKLPNIQRCNNNTKHVTNEKYSAFQAKIILRRLHHKLGHRPSTHAQ